MVTTKPELYCQVRWMIKRDMDAVNAIEATLADTWSEETILAAVRQRNTIAMIVEHRETLVGYMIYELHTKCLRLKRLAVRSDLRLRGAGRTMLAKLMSKLSSLTRTSVVADVAEDRLDIHLFLRSCGFIASAVHRGAGENGGDTYEFVGRLSAPEPELE